jgi:putative transposase
MYARGMTTREIEGHLKKIYGVEVRAALVSQVTEAVSEEVKRWQSRTLEPIDGIVYLDALYVKMRHEGRVENPRSVCGHRSGPGGTQGGTRGR